MAGYWRPSSFFACLWTETKSRSINSQKRTRPISSHLDQTNLVNKGFIIWLLVKFCLRDTAGSPERARWLHLARSGSQSQRAIWFILPAHGASHIIRENLDGGQYPFQPIKFVNLVVPSPCETEPYNKREYLALINQAGGLYGRILTEVVSTDRTQ